MNKPPLGWTPVVASMIGGVRALRSEDGYEEVACFVGIDGRPKVAIRYRSKDGTDLEAGIHEAPGDVVQWVLTKPLVRLTEDDCTAFSLGLDRVPLDDGTRAILVAGRNVEGRDHGWPKEAISVSVFDGFWWVRVDGDHAVGEVLSETALRLRGEPPPERPLRVRGDSYPLDSPHIEWGPYLGKEPTRTQELLSAALQGEGNDPGWPSAKETEFEAGRRHGQAEERERTNDTLQRIADEVAKEMAQLGSPDRTAWPDASDCEGHTEYRARWYSFERSSEVPRVMTRAEALGFDAYPYHRDLAVVARVKDGAQ